MSSNTDPPIPRFVAVGNTIATVAVTAAAVMSAIGAPRSVVTATDLTLVIVLAIVHVIMGSLGLYLIERRGRRRTLHLHFIAAILVSAGAVSFGKGWSSLLVLSLISQSVLYLDRVRALLAILCASVAPVLMFVLHTDSSKELVQALVGWAAGVAFVVFFSRMTERQHHGRREVERLASELGEANERLRVYAKEVHELSTAREKNRIAREIHDGLGHYLTVVHVQLQAAEATLRSEPDKAEVGISRAQQLIHEGLAEVRRSVGMLRGSAPAPKPIADALAELADACVADGVSAAVRVSGPPRSLPDPVEFTLYRAAQEALTNVRRHAQASRVTIELTYESTEHVRLSVEDDGAGSESPAGGFGLVGLRERAEIVGGTVKIRTSRGAGFAIEVQVPG